MTVTHKRLSLLLVLVVCDMFKKGVPLNGLEHSRFDGFFNRRLRHFVLVLTLYYTY